MMAQTLRKASSLGYTVFACIILIAALAGLLFKLNGELAGLGRVSRRGGLRAPHGRLVRTKRLDAVEEAPFATRFGICLAAVAAITVTCGVLVLVGVFSWGSTGLLAAHFALCVAACVALAQSDAGVWRPLGHALAGYLVMAALPAALWAYEIPPVAGLHFSDVNMLTVALAALGCAFSVALMPAVFAYAREFEDGHVNAIQVTSRSVARRAFDALADPSWEPPADRVRDYAAAEDPRAFMGKR